MDLYKGAHVISCHNCCGHETGKELNNEFHSTCFSHILFSSKNHANFYIDNLKVLSFEEFKATRPALAIVVKKKLLSRWALPCSAPCIQAALHFDLDLSKHSSRLEEKMERKDEVRGEKQLLIYPIYRLMEELMKYIKPMNAGTLFRSI